MMLQMIICVFMFIVGMVLTFYGISSVYGMIGEVNDVVGPWILVSIFGFIITVTAIWNAPFTIFLHN